MPPVAAPKAATINGARALGVGERFSSIEAGKWANLLVAVGNRLEHIEDARNFQLVMQAGQVFDANDLLKSVEGKIGPRELTMSLLGSCQRNIVVSAQRDRAS
jgi:hypothetical protein